MERRTVISRSMVVLVFIAIAMVVSPAVNSLPTGIGGDNIQTQGCNCHNTLPSSNVIPSLAGLPEEYNVSTTYTLTISFSGGPAEGGVNSGGFNLWASGGDFSVVDATVQARSPTELTHTEAGNDYRSWTIEWTSPDHGRNVDFILHVNSVNGDGANTGGNDEWNRLDVTVEIGRASCRERV